MWSGEKNRVDTAVVAFLRVSVTMMSSPGTTGPPASIIQVAEGMLVSPKTVSLTVQVRVGPELPASSGSDSETSLLTPREPAGTG